MMQGATACLPCAPGLFSGEYGASSCQDCEAGKYAKRLNSTSCTSCEPGFFNDTRRATICAACAPDNFRMKAGPQSAMIASLEATPIRPKVLPARLATQDFSTTPDGRRYARHAARVNSQIPPEPQSAMTANLEATRIQAKVLPAQLATQDFSTTPDGRRYARHAARVNSQIPPGPQSAMTANLEATRIQAKVLPAQLATQDFSTTPDGRRYARHVPRDNSQIPLEQHPATSARWARLPSSYRARAAHYAKKTPLATRQGKVRAWHAHQT